MTTWSRPALAHAEPADVQFLAVVHHLDLHPAWPRGSALPWSLTTLAPVAVE
jgi:hypothetical protein